MYVRAYVSVGWLVGRRRFLGVFFGYKLFSLAVYLTAICWQLAFT